MQPNLIECRTLFGEKKFFLPTNLFNGHRFTH